MLVIPSKSLFQGGLLAVPIVAETEDSEIVLRDELLFEEECRILTKHRGSRWTGPERQLATDDQVPAGSGSAAENIDRRGEGGRDSSHRNGRVTRA